MLAASAEDSDRTVFRADSPEFKKALSELPDSLVDLIYSQLKIRPERYVELAQAESETESAADVSVENERLDEDMEELAEQEENS